MAFPQSEMESYLQGMRHRNDVTADSFTKNKGCRVENRLEEGKGRTVSQVEGCYTFQASHDGNSQGDCSGGGEKRLDYG